MFNRHSLPALALCAIVAAVGLAPSVACAHGFGGQSLGSIGRTASNIRAITRPTLPGGGLHPAFLNPQPLPPSPAASARSYR
jgi:hypothetical protein